MRPDRPIGAKIRPIGQWSGRLAQRSGRFGNGQADSGNDEGGVRGGAVRGCDGRESGASSGAFTLTPPDLNSSQARNAAKKAGVSMADLNTLRQPQSSGMSGSDLNSLDRKITAKNHR